eukprot:11173447-Lingulodinium_polyedra.AAC.1
MLTVGPPRARRGGRRGPAVSAPWARRGFAVGHTTAIRGGLRFCGAAGLGWRTHNRTRGRTEQI